MACEVAAAVRSGRPQRCCPNPFAEHGIRAARYREIASLAPSIRLTYGPVGFGRAEDRSRLTLGEESPNTTGRDAA